MKIVLTGGGTGGHFYPLIAVADEIYAIAKEKRIITPELYFTGTDPFDKGLLYDKKITFVAISAGKIRPYFSLRNIIDPFFTVWGCISAVIKLLGIYPDVIFSKGGYGSFPTIVAGVILRIPIIIHESDSVPGKVNKWAGKFASRIALSWPEAAKYFPEKKTAITGNPIREDIMIAPKDTGKEYFSINPADKVVLVLGGSQGARRINDEVVEALPQIVQDAHVIHQTGPANFEDITKLSRVILPDPQQFAKYKPYPNLDPLTLKMAAGAADIIITRAGSTLFEIASWETPAIVIPITSSNGDHQRMNAFAYARAGAGIVIEENNLTTNVLVAEIRRILSSQELTDSMKQAAAGFAKRDAAKLIAEALISIGLSHES